MLKIIGGNVVVEIGSTRRELTQNCISYHNNSMKLESKDAPPCCQDGHSTHFWVREGFETYTVDIDTSCIAQLQSQYEHHIKTPIPSNLHICIPQDGIEFLKNFDKKIDLLFCTFKSCPTYGITNPKLKISAKLDKIIKKTKKIR